MIGTMRSYDQGVGKGGWGWVFALPANDIYIAIGLQQAMILQE
jgi:hypothetical protein